MQKKECLSPVSFATRQVSQNAGPFEINTEETPAVKTVKPFMFTVRAGIVVRAYRTYACIAELCHYLSIVDWRQGHDFL
jgi:hypothetical protein